MGIRWAINQELTKPCRCCALVRGSVPGTGAAWLTIVVVVSALFSACTSSSESPEGLALHTIENKVKVSWFVGLGTGSQSEQIEAQHQIVDLFNSSSDTIEIELEIVDNEVAFEVLRNRIDTGDAPDIVGPVGIRGASVFEQDFLDIEPLLESQGFDLGPYGQAQVDVWRTTEGGLLGLPFGVFPSFVYYNVDLFDQAGLPVPPHSFEEFYDGQPWTTDVLYDLALELTLDANGVAASSPNFDPDMVTQWGFHHQFIDDLRAHGTFFGAGALASDDGTATIPSNWLAEWNWYHDLIWKGHGAPSSRQIVSALLGDGNAFNSGNVAMAYSHLWYTGSLRDSDGNGQDFFDIAVAPSYDETTTSKLHADTFGVLRSSKNAPAAVEVLRYLVGEAAPELLQTYGSFPARQDLRSSFLQALDTTFPQGVDWSVLETSLLAPDLPSHEMLLPNAFEAQDLLDKMQKLLVSDPDIDVDELARLLEIDLSEVFASAGSGTADYEDG